MPSIHVHLFINTGSPIIIYPNCDKKKPVCITKGWLKGLHEKPYGIELGEYTRSISIRFKPCAAYALLLKPMNLISNKIIPAEDMEIPGFTSLHSEFEKNTDPEKIEKIVNDYLKAHIKPKEFDRPRIFNVLQKIQNQKSKAGLPELAEEAGVSTKHLNTLFDKFIGLSPKKFGNILRFNELLQEITKQQNNDWKVISKKFGYYDQSHFIHDFKKFTGLTPSEFIKNYLIIDNNVFRKDMNNTLGHAEPVEA